MMNAQYLGLAVVALLVAAFVYIRRRRSREIAEWVSLQARPALCTHGKRRADCFHCVDEGTGQEEEEEDELQDDEGTPPPGTTLSAAADAALEAVRRAMDLPLRINFAEPVEVRLEFSTDGNFCAGNFEMAVLDARGPIYPVVEQIPPNIINYGTRPLDFVRARAIVLPRTRGITRIRAFSLRHGQCILDSTPEMIREIQR